MYVESVRNDYKQTTNSTTKLSQLFLEERLIAWDMVQLECNIYINNNVTVQQITQLSHLYMKIIEKLNCLQDYRQKYFSNKMQKLMAQPFVIRCFSNHAQNKNPKYDHKRKQLQLQLQMQTQKHNSHMFQHIMNKQSQKQKKIVQKIQQVIGSHQKTLADRIKKRKQAKNYSKNSIYQTPKKKNSCQTTLSNQIQSLYQSRNPQYGSQQSNRLTFLDLTKCKNKPANHKNQYALKTQSERLINFNLNEDSSSSDQDQYKIKKIIEEQKRNKMMVKKKRLPMSSIQKK